MNVCWRELTRNERRLKTTVFMDDWKKYKSELDRNSKNKHKMAYSNWMYVCSV
jgi:hypothetical protein